MSKDIYREGEAEAQQQEEPQLPNNEISKHVKGGRIAWKYLLHSSPELAKETRRVFVHGTQAERDDQQGRARFWRGQAIWEITMPADDTGEFSARRLTYDRRGLPKDKEKVSYNDPNVRDSMPDSAPDVVAYKDRSSSPKPNTQPAIEGDFRLREQFRIDGRPSQNRW